MRVVTIRLSSRIKVVLILWCLGEVLAFALVANVIGFAGAILLGVGTSILGFTLLKRAGASALVKLRAAMEGRSAMEGRRPAGPTDVIDDTLAVAGAVALVMPGFLSDIAGMALMVPAVRALVTRLAGRAGLAGGRRAPPPPGTIDLDPDQWQRGDPAARPISKV